MEIEFSNQKPAQTGVLIVPVYNGGALGSKGKKLDKELGDVLSSRMSAKSFEGKTGQTLNISIDEALGAKDVVLVGMGNPDVLDTKTVRNIALQARKAVLATGETDSVFLADKTAKLNMDVNEMAAEFADAMDAADYTFNKYKMTANDNKGLILRAVVPDPVFANVLHAELKAVTDAQKWAKDLGNEPPNKLTPAVYANRIVEEMSKYDNVKLKVMDEEDMKERGMHAALAVSQGSTKNPGRIVVIEYDGTGGSQDRPIGFVGKGVTFDTGGYNLKPGGSMADMKTDMGGSAAVVGAMRALASREANVKAVAVVGLVENMVDGHAYRPSDIIGSMSGKTIEIGNTDAEGRLVMADCMTLIQRDYNPTQLTTTATLTGAMVMALADTYTGVFANDDVLANDILEAGRQTGDLGWRMPLLNEAFTNSMKGREADLSNTGSMRGAGASTAAAFLREFVEKDENGQDAIPFAHLDIAGTFRTGSGVTGVGVRLYDRMVDNVTQREGGYRHVYTPQADYG
ncbi:MAG: leucyl aminopeptidase family protein [Alphaproteobacteria bacterium]